MQTFLPYTNFHQVAATLDNKRLGKQRVEAKQIYDIVSGKRTTGGWLNHPAVLMWHGHADALAYYHDVMIIEWEHDRGFKNNMPLLVPQTFDLPWWLKDKTVSSNLILSHRASLLRKAPDYYDRYKWQIDDPDMGYVWPTKLGD